ncbi:MAG: HAD-IA family hydrolase [Patescibacteria group bacterium]
MIKAVLFDIDGTIVNSLGNYLQVYKKTINHFGFNFSDSEVADRCFNKSEEDITKGLGIPEKAEEFRYYYFDLTKKTIPSLKLFPDVISTLDFLISKKIQIGLITFAYNWYMYKIVNQFNLAKYTKVIIGFNDVKNAKPNPEAVNKACKILQIKEEDSLVIGDSKNDMLMGKNAGSKTAYYIPEENSKFYNFEAVVNEINPDYQIKKLSEILGLVDLNK